MAMTEEDWKPIDLAKALERVGILLSFDSARQVLHEMHEVAKERRLLALVKATT